MSDIEATLADAFAEEYGADETTAADAAAKVAAYREDHDEDLTAEAVLDAFESGPYGEFRHDFDYAVGDLAAANEDCTDSRPYRLAGFGDLAAEPEQGV